MTFLQAWVRELVALLLVAGALELMLPENKMRGYVRMVMGLVVMVSLLRPAFGLLQQSVALEFTDYALPVEGRAVGSAELRRQAERLQAGQAALAAEQVRRQAAAYVAGLAQGVPGVARARAEVELGPGRSGAAPEIRAVRLWVLPAGPAAGGGQAAGGEAAGSLVEPVRPVEPVQPAGTRESAAAGGSAAGSAGEPDAGGLTDPLARAVRTAVARELGLPPAQVAVAPWPAENP